MFTPNLTFPILPAPSVFCSCQSPTIRYLFLLLEAPLLEVEGGVPLDTCWVEGGGTTGACLALSVLETEAVVSSLMVGSAGLDEGAGWVDVAELKRESVLDRCGDLEGVRLTGSAR